MFNKTFLLGNLTRDVELRYTASGTAVAKFGLATNRKYNGSDGELKEEVCFVDLTAWGKQAETLDKYVKKGDPIFIEGRLQFDSWEDKSGQKRSKLSVVVETFKFLNRRSGPTPTETGATAKTEDYGDIPF